MALPGRLKMAIGWLAVLACCAGCDPGSAIDEPAVVQPPPSPEIRFERLLEELRRLVESNSGPTQSYTAGDTRYAGGYQIVDSKIIPPETKEGVYRAKITIRGASSITVFSTDDPEPAEEESTELDEPGLLLGEEPEEEELASKSTVRSRLLSSPVQTRTDEDLLEFNLSYVEGHWVLRTEIDPLEREFLSEAFRRALGRQ